MTESKQCDECGETKPRVEFIRSGWRCKVCSHAYQMKWRQQRREAKRALGPELPPGMMMCNYCNTLKPQEMFAPQRRRCIPCRNVYSQAWRLANPDKVRAHIEKAGPRTAYEFRRRAVRAGVDPFVVAEHYAMTSGRCEICGGDSGTRDISIDHDHQTGQFRGLLCNNCNNGLGRFKDDPELLRKAIDYLQQVSPGDLYRLLGASS